MQFMLIAEKNLQNINYNRIAISLIYGFLQTNSAASAIDRRISFCLFFGTPLELTGSVAVLILLGYRLNPPLSPLDRGEREIPLRIELIIRYKYGAYFTSSINFNVSLMTISTAFSANIVLAISYPFSAYASFVGK